MVIIMAFVKKTILLIFVLFTLGLFLLLNVPTVNAGFTTCNAQNKTCSANTIQWPDCTCHALDEPNTDNVYTQCIQMGMPASCCGTPGADNSAARDSQECARDFNAMSNEIQSEPAATNRTYSDPEVQTFYNSYYSCCLFHIYTETKNIILQTPICDYTS